MLWECGKAKFTKKEATTKLNDFRKGILKTRHRPKRVYYCSYCKAWHLTSQDKNWYDEDNEE